MKAGRYLSGYDAAVGTPFEGGVFKMKLVLGSDFPNAPPKGVPPCTLNSSLLSVKELSAMKWRKFAEHKTSSKAREYLPLWNAGFFLTKIFHPNVSKPGEICVNVLKRDWKPEMGLRHVLVIVRCLLIEPFPGSPEKS